MITLDTLRAEVARGMAPHDMNLLPGHETCAYCLENREHALKKADEAIAIVLRAVAKEADTFVGTGRDIHDLIAQIDTCALAAGGGR